MPFALLTALAACEFETYRVMVLLGFLCVALWAMLTDWRGRLAWDVGGAVNAAAHGDDRVAKIIEDLLRALPSHELAPAPLRVAQALRGPLIATLSPSYLLQLLHWDFYGTHVRPVVSRVASGGCDGSVVLCGGGPSPLAFSGAVNRLTNTAAASGLGLIPYALRCAKMHVGM